MKAGVAHLKLQMLPRKNVLTVTQIQILFLTQLPRTECPIYRPQSQQIKTFRRVFFLMGVMFTYSENYKETDKTQCSSVLPTFLKQKWSYYLPELQHWMTSLNSHEASW